MKGSRQHSAVAAVAVVAAVMLVVSQAAFVYADHNIDHDKDTAAESGLFGDTAQIASRIPGGSVSRECDEMFGDGVRYLLLHVQLTVLADCYHCYFYYYYYYCVYLCVLILLLLLLLSYSLIFLLCVFLLFLFFCRSSRGLSTTSSRRTT